MKTLRIDRQNLTRMSLLVALLAVLALATVQRVKANQSGSTVNEQSEFQIAMCRGAGGIDTVISIRTPGSGLMGTIIMCKGGLLDGMFCKNTQLGTWCTFDYIRPEEGATLPTTGEIEQVDTTSLPTLETVDETIDPVVAEDVVDESTTPEPDATDEPVVDEPEIVEDVVDTDIVEDPALDPVQDTQWTDSVDVVEPVQIEEAPQDVEYFDSSEIIILGP
jgi:hypothetical protein